MNAWPKQTNPPTMNQITKFKTSCNWLYLKEQIESEKALQASLDNELKSGDKKTKHIRIKSATLRDKQGASDQTVKKKQNDLEGRLYRANRFRGFKILFRVVYQCSR